MNVASHGLHEDNLGELGQHRARAVARRPLPQARRPTRFTRWCTLAKVDVRGCLAIDRAVKVGFRSMTCHVQLRVPADVDPTRVAMLRKQAEQSCVNLDSLRSGVPVDLVLNIEATSEGRAAASRYLQFFSRMLEPVPRE